MRQVCSCDFFTVSKVQVDGQWIFRKVVPSPVLIRFARYVSSKTDWLGGKTIFRIMEMLNIAFIWQTRENFVFQNGNPWYHS